MQMIVIQLNGEPYEVAANMTISELVSTLEEPQERLAIEWNGSILSRELWATTELQSGDQLEIVQFVGGGELTSGHSQ
jgi:thiamine biosynthesis protein ThiS